MRGAEIETLWGREEDRWTPYLSRATVGRLRFNIFHRGDADAHCHDHVANFWTFPLTSYVEEFWSDDNGGDPGPWYRCRRVVKAFRLHHRRAEFAHRVIGRWTGVAAETDDGQIATINWWGRRRREWGFILDTGAWVPWKQHLGIE